MAQQTDEGDRSLLPSHVFTTAAQLMDCIDSGRAARLTAANLVLQDTLERVIVNAVYSDIQRGVYLVRGENVVLLGEIDTAADESIPLQKVTPEQILKLQKEEMDDRKRKEQNKNSRLADIGFSVDQQLEDINESKTRLAGCAVDDVERPGKDVGHGRGHGGHEVDRVGGGGGGRRGLDVVAGEEVLVRAHVAGPDVAVKVPGRVCPEALERGVAVAGLAPLLERGVVRAQEEPDVEVGHDRGHVVEHEPVDDAEPRARRRRRADLGGDLGGDGRGRLGRDRRRADLVGLFLGLEIRRERAVRADVLERTHEAVEVERLGTVPVDEAVDDGDVDLGLASAGPAMTHLEEVVLVEDERPGQDVLEQPPTRREPFTPTFPMDDVNEYERQRRANIERNNALLRELELAGLGNALAEPARAAPAGITKRTRKGENAGRPTRRTRAPPRKKAEAVPRRMSARLAGEKADFEVEQAKAEEYAAAAQERIKQERQRVGGDMPLAEIAQNGADAWRFDLDDDDDADEARTAERKDVVRLRDELGKMTLYERFPPVDIRIQTPERIFCLGFHPSNSKRMVLAGDKVGTLGIWNVDEVAHVKREDDGEDGDAADADADEEPQVFTFKVHARTLSGFAFAPGDGTRVYSTSYDGSVRCVDLGAGVSSELLYHERDGEPDAISAVEMVDPHVAYYSTLAGELCRLDVRAPETVARYRLHDKKIGGFGLHPGAPHLAVSASLDRTMKLWDLRRMSATDEGETQPAALGTYESRLSVSCASFSRSGRVVCNGYDDRVCVFDLGSAASWPAAAEPVELVPAASFTHNCQTGRWVSILKACWQQDPRDGAAKFAIGNMNRYMDVYSDTGVQLARFADRDLITAVPAVCRFHPTQNWLAGGTASGKPPAGALGEMVVYVHEFGGSAALAPVLVGQGLGGLVRAVDEVLAELLQPANEFWTSGARLDTYGENSVDASASGTTYVRTLCQSIRYLPCLVWRPMLAEPVPL
ncbi:WD40-repeat-containing domain protein [Dipodascopsis tothii]|uniref:WD40-repeat-containing domain protein n=1 Tax=Dipodascopsis tothii TaxID=44089 RepID=UPI0034CDFE4F